VRLDGLAHLDHAASALIESWERSHRERGGHVVVDLTNHPDHPVSGPPVNGRP
jgi:hypothetical protein